ncbi:MAG: winged helix-turn-helix transcriptional regulator, partial [Clostridiales bacterium]|nr:winged helix-turn-helix transcriptional regulator [Clostridiales bacterium]
MSDTKQGRLSDKAEQALLQQIHSGELPVGAKLPSEPTLAKEMGLSRGILREALNSLQAKGYISRTPRGGSYVTRTADNHIGDSITAKVRSAELRD